MAQEEFPKGQSVWPSAHGLVGARSKLETLSFAQESEEFYDALCSPCSDTNFKSFDSDAGSKSFCGRSQSSEFYSPSCGCTRGSKRDCNKCNLKNGRCFMSSPSLNDGVVGNRCGSRRKRRTAVPPKADNCFSLWSLVKHCMGKDLTRIPLPVYFNEPLSTLQRLTEEYEYSELLSLAAKCESSCEQMVYVTAFVISSYSSSSKRTGKPFNPLLGETFECDRTEDLGWRCISEQVSHHPPILAQHCEGPGWVAWQEFTMTTKLKGTSLLVNPVGINHLKFEKSAHHYTWNKVSTTVHNLVIGTLWLDHHGELIVKNHTTGDECCVQFIPYKCFSSETYRKVTGIVKNDNQVACWVLRGTWDQKIQAAKIISSDGEDSFKTGNFKLIWKRVVPSTEEEKYYNMTLLACQLNEPEDSIAPTDSRFRPDQRLMEIGKWEEANQVKVELEEKQRRKRKLCEENASEEGQGVESSPVWFKLATDEVTNMPMHIYTGEYWDCKSKAEWSRCPDIFL